ncbi:amidohydrolase [Crocinitomicaceae bacterium]|nr:amidohydrolase [Crocinitomicaceae bacterium]
MRKILFLVILFGLNACMKSESVDLVIFNANIHGLDEKNQTHQAMAIRDGKIIEMGPDRQILNKYRFENSIDAEGKEIYPGFIDAHGHLFSYAELKLGANILGCESEEDMLTRVHQYQDNSKRDIVIGLGWDQSLWELTDLPNNSRLNEEFPETPVCLFRIDGHSALVNEAFIEKIDDVHSDIRGGEVLMTNGMPNGMFIDAAISLLEPHIPDYSIAEIKRELLNIQKELFGFGITGVHEAGIDYNELGILREMVEDESLRLNIYAMLNPTAENKSFALTNGPYKSKNLRVRSFKAYVDGALGSSGALLKNDYSDKPNYRGLSLMSSEELNKLSEFCLDVGYQLNSHGIGDSAISIILDMCSSAYKANPDHRFRIEHAQIVDIKDLHKFADYGVFPSVQPTHATTDQRWIESKIGAGRMKGAYAFKSLKDQLGMIALGTDFPVEYTNPFYTIHASVHRKNFNNEPAEGFLIDEALTFEETLKGMTFWNAFSAFEEGYLGTLEVGKNATFVILDKPLNRSSNFMGNFSWKTYIDGRLVHSLE